MFTKAPETYSRDLNHIRIYLEEAAHYISTVKEIPYDVAYAKLSAEFGKGGKHEIKPRIVEYLDREKDDRVLKKDTLNNYLKMVSDNNYIMVPTFTAYIPASIKPSIIAKFINYNIQRRKVVKGLMFECKQRGDTEGEVFNEILQTTYKQKSNSLSGTYAVPSTPLYNVSGHTTLTSTTCGAATIANASNERFVRGNRHYFNRNITINNIVSVVTHSDYGIIEEAMKTFGLNYPTVEQTIQVVRYSTDLYWPYPEHFVPVANYIAKLTPIQRAAYCYTGDFYHLRQYNAEFMRRFISEIIAKDATPVNDPVGAIKALTGPQRDMLGIFCGDILQGELLNDLIQSNDPRIAAIGAIAEHTRIALERYALLFQAFMVTSNVPAAIADFPSSCRRTVVLSDTDSTLYTVQDWVRWYSGRIDFTERSNDVAALMVYLSSQQIKHFLGVMSGNLGIATEDIFGISLKNELMYPVFVLSGRAKHDFAYIRAREGNVFRELEIEQKGVGYKESNVPAVIMDGVNKLIIHIMDSVMKEGEIDLHKLLTDIGNLERQVRDSVIAGKTEYLPRATIKSKESYTESKDGKDKVNPYAYHELWRDVFANKYGEPGEPDYSSIKISLTTDSKAKLNEWLGTLQDHDMVARFREWIERTKRDKLKTILLPAHLVMSSGVPSELIPIIDVRKQVYIIVRAYYLVLESIGYYINVGDNMKYLISDEY